MQLEDYFDFLASDDIRLKGHRIGIDNVLDYYLEGYTPEEIVANLPTLSLEQVHATITFKQVRLAPPNPTATGFTPEREPWRATRAINHRERRPLRREGARR